MEMLANRLPEYLPCDRRPKRLRKNCEGRASRWRVGGPGPRHPSFITTAICWRPGRAIEAATWRLLRSTVKLISDLRSPKGFVNDALQFLVQHSVILPEFL